MVSQGAMSQPVAGAGGWSTKCTLGPRVRARRSPSRGPVAGRRPNSLPLNSASRKYGLELFADHTIDGTTPGATEEDRRIEDRQQQRELPAAARAREKISVACVPVGHDRHLHGEHERKRTREESHGERRATKKFQNAEKIGPGQGPREAEWRQDILRHRPG